MPKFPRDAYFRGSLWKTGFLHHQSASCPDIFVRSKKKRRSLRERLRLLWVALKDMMDLSVFRSPVFVCFCLHSLLLYVSYDIPYMYLPDLAQQLGISSMQSSYLLSVCGIASTFGQVGCGVVLLRCCCCFCGIVGMLLWYFWYFVVLLVCCDIVGMLWYCWYVVVVLLIHHATHPPNTSASTTPQIVIGYVGDKPRVNSRYLYIVMMVVAGVSTTFIPLLHHFSSFLIFSFVFGFTISANYCLTTIIIVDLLGMEQLTNAYGFVTLSEGTANLVGVPLGG